MQPSPLGSPGCGSPKVSTVPPAPKGVPRCSPSCFLWSLRTWPKRLSQRWQRSASCRTDGHASYKWLDDDTLTSSTRQLYIGEANSCGCRGDQGVDECNRSWHNRSFLQCKTFFSVCYYSSVAELLVCFLSFCQRVKSCYREEWDLRIIRAGTWLTVHRPCRAFGFWTSYIQLKFGPDAQWLLPPFTVTRHGHRSHVSSRYSLLQNMLRHNYSPRCS